MTPLKVSQSNNSIQFTLPTTISPRYESVTTTTTTKKSKASNIPFMDKVPYKIKVEMEMEMPSNIENVVSPSHKIKVITKKRTANIRFLEESIDKDFVIEAFLEKAHEPRMWIEIPGNENKDEMAAMLCFFPNLEDQQVTTEVIFVIDR
jgi:preprotein translocase subunit SecD